MTKNKIFVNSIICYFKGHQSRLSYCPFTGKNYDICDRCNGTKVVK